MLQLIYASRPFGFDMSHLANILMTSRARNKRDDITGALICRADLYLQLLEGPEGKIENAYARILEDDRHLDVRLLVQSPVQSRLFPKWAMRDDPAKSWMWTQDQVRDGAVEAASATEVVAVFERLAAEVG
jgi:hypothetical protein